LHFFKIEDDSRPTLKKLLKAQIITNVSSKWYWLGIHLLDENQAPHLETIRANNDDVTERCFALFGYWLQTHPDASWYELVVALRAPGVELNELAASVEKTFHGRYTLLGFTVHRLKV